MIRGALITHNTCGLPDIFWREARFCLNPATELTYMLDPSGPVTVRLPADLRGAVIKRRSEYLAGRAVAALALREAGLPEQVGRRDRAPLWPKGSTGSISHTDTRVIAVVSRSHAGLGVDCETIMTPSQAAEIHPMVLTPAEAGQHPGILSFSAFLTLVFSAKEALYKAVSARLERIPEFCEATLTSMS
ncbi:MAG: 4'-phosphopantetheinyl transferase family protein, partial [Rhodobacterales bacterium]